MNCECGRYLLNEEIEAIADIGGIVITIKCSVCGSVYEAYIRYSEFDKVV